MSFRARSNSVEGDGHEKTLAIVLLVPQLLCASGSAGLISKAGELPDPGTLLSSNAFICDEILEAEGKTYIAFMFPMPSDHDAFLAAYTAEAEAALYTVSDGGILDMDAKKIADGARKPAVGGDSVGGTRSLCHGSGWYRMYGEKVPCSIFCQTCDGLGYWYTTQPVFVPRSRIPCIT